MDRSTSTSLRGPSPVDFARRAIAFAPADDLHSRVVDGGELIV
jgi:hypothetical protein